MLCFLKLVLPVTAKKVDDGVCFWLWTRRGDGCASLLQTGRGLEALTHSPTSHRLFCSQPKHTLCLLLLTDCPINTRLLTPALFHILVGAHQRYSSAALYSIQPTVNADKYPVLLHYSGNSSPSMRGACVRPYTLSTLTCWGLVCSESDTHALAGFSVTQLPLIFNRFLRLAHSSTFHSVSRKEEEGLPS